MHVWKERECLWNPNPPCIDLHGEVSSDSSVLRVDLTAYTSLYKQDSGYIGLLFLPHRYIRYINKIRPMLTIDDIKLLYLGFVWITLRKKMIKHFTFCLFTQGHSPVNVSVIRPDVIRRGLRYLCGCAWAVQIISLIPVQILKDWDTY